MPYVERTIVAFIEICSFAHPGSANIIAKLGMTNPETHTYWIYIFSAFVLM
jgi:hypothetical protein